MTRQPDSYYESNYVVTLSDGKKGIYVSDGIAKQFVSTSASRSGSSGAIPALNRYLLNLNRSLVELSDGRSTKRSGAVSLEIDQAVDSWGLYSEYLDKGRVYNLTSVLEKSDPVGKVFYYPKDYYYVGDEEIPKYSAEKAAQAVAAYQAEADKNKTSYAPTAQNDDNDKNNWIWLLLPVGALLLTRFMKSDGGNERKRKR